MKLKLNKRRTFLIAFAFFGIMMLWKVYYYYVPLYLEELLINKFGTKENGYNYIIGIIMSFDNLAAILLIPLFGWLSDRTKARIGRRMPYIIWGSFLSLTLFPLIAVMYILNAFAWYFVIIILLVFSMAVYRSPAVSLMPDATPKPLRTSANAIINFIGYLGAIAGAGLTMLFTKIDDTTQLIKNPSITIIPFIITSILTAAIIVIFLLRFFERKTVALMQPELQEGERQSQTIERVEEGKPLSKRDRINFVIIISAVFCCWFAFNALQNFGSLYGTKILKTDKWGACEIALAVSSLATFLPSIWLSKKIGRKWSVILGLMIVIMSLVLSALFVKSFGALIIALFMLSGIGWAVVMVNSYPMFVEMSSSQNVGRITGIYYIASQGAMFVTSIVSGFVFDWLGREFYFTYALIFMSIACLICLFFKSAPKILHPNKTQINIE